MSTVLIVEDNQEIAGLYERVFARHTTRVLDDLPEALGYLEHDHPDLVILDFHLPSGSGLDLLKFIRSHPVLSELPIVAITADDLLREAATREGVNAFLMKPFEISDLIKITQQFLSRTRPAISAEMRAMLTEYTDAHQRVYNRPPTGQWTGSKVIIDGQPRDEAWLKAEIRRLRSLTAGGAPRNYLHRLIDKIRRL